jgi:putative transposase
MILAGFIADQRTTFGVSQAVACRALGVSESWFYKWRNHTPSAGDIRRGVLDAAVKGFFDVSKGTYGSPRILVDLRETGWTISKKTVEVSMRRQGLVARSKKKKGGLTRADRRARKAPDLLERDFTAEAPDEKWCGDMTEIPTGEGPLVLATTGDLFSRRALGFAMGESATAELAKASLLMAAARRGGSVTGVIFHSDQGSTYTADEFEKACSQLGVARSMGRVGSSLDNAPAESFFSTLKTEFTSRHTFATKEEARRRIAAWIDDWYNPIRRHSTIGMMSPVAYEQAARAATTDDRAA